MTFRISLDSSILISHLAGDIHKDSVLSAVERLNQLEAELFFSVVCYVEVWTGIELMNDGQKKELATASFTDILDTNNFMIVADNITIARDAARAQAEYRRRGGKREALVPDFLTGANASYFCGRLLTTNPRDFLRSFPSLEVLTPIGLVEKYTA